MKTSIRTHEGRVALVTGGGQGIDRTAATDRKKNWTHFRGSFAHCIVSDNAHDARTRVNSSNTPKPAQPIKSADAHKEAAWYRS
jgi:hypothetical protein